MQLLLHSWHLAIFLLGSLGPLLAAELGLILVGRRKDGELASWAPAPQTWFWSQGWGRPNGVGIPTLLVTHQANYSFSASCHNPLSHRLQWGPGNTCPPEGTSNGNCSFAVISWSLPRPSVQPLRNLAPGRCQAASAQGWPRAGFRKPKSAS